MSRLSIGNIWTLSAASLSMLLVAFQPSCSAGKSTRSGESYARKGTIRRAFVMSVNPGQELEYHRRHNPIWPELEDVLKKHGVVTYSIFLHSETRQLFGYAEFEDEEQWNAVAKTGVCQRWWAYMKDIMPSNPDNSPVSKDLKEVFHIERWQ